MADLLNGGLVNSGLAARRAADVLLRGVGGRAVMLRMPAPASAGDAAEQLGLAVPEFQDMELAPVVLRRETKGLRELVVSATAVNALVGSLGYSAASVLFADAFGVLVDGVLMAVEGMEEKQIGGSPYIYLLKLRRPVSLAV